MQRQRWYPTAMVMSNGSILVVGGELGSNGAPEPSLEILPRPPGGDTWMFLDYLNRTDPNNLYPYLITLPSGRIFIGASSSPSCSPPPPRRTAQLTHRMRVRRVLQRGASARPGDACNREGAAEHAWLRDKLPRWPDVPHGRLRRHVPAEGPVF